MKRKFKSSMITAFSFGLALASITSVFASSNDEQKQKRPSTTYKVKQDDGSSVKVKVKSHNQFKVDVKQTYKGQKITLKPYK